MRTNANEPISPTTTAEWPEDGTPFGAETKHNGLTKREYFAAMAMQAQISHYGDGWSVKQCVEAADALIEALNATSKDANRERAIAWWNGKTDENKRKLCKDWLPSFVSHTNLTGLQIEIVYEKATGKKEGI